MGYSDLTYKQLLVLNRYSDHILCTYYDVRDRNER